MKVRRERPDRFAMAECYDEAGRISFRFGLVPWYAAMQYIVMPNTVFGVWNGGVGSVPLATWRKHRMHRANKFVASLFLTTALAAPAVILASPAAQEDRVYDRDHKDYHQWDDRERGAWGRFLTEKHRKEHEFQKASRKEQNEYWSWRHSHPD
jgi:hypothetical protein